MSKRSPEEQAKGRREALQTVAWLCAAAALIAMVRENLFEQEHAVNAEHDVYFLPPPKQVVRMSLGYRHAFADVLWAHLLVGQGLRIRERRRFDTLLPLYDAINELDPTFRTPYLMADALITFNVVPTTKGSAAPAEGRTIPFEEVQKAREIMERGHRNRPQDAEILLTLGQFVSFVAPASYMEDRPEEAERWRREGVEYLKKAVDLSGGNSRFAWQALGGAAILREAGEVEAMVDFYERAYAVTDDDELRQALAKKLDDLRRKLSKLDAANDQRVHDKLLESATYRERGRLREQWSKSEFPFLERATNDVLGPPIAPARCAGLHTEDAWCATTWDDWVQRMQAAGR